MESGYRICDLRLSNYRNYNSLSIKPHSDFVVVTGKNGSGKTNLLEAVSLLIPGKGLRGVNIKNFVKHDSEMPWSVFANVLESGIDKNIGTSLDLSKEKPKRIIKIDGEVVKNQEVLSDFISIMWLTPKMDGLLSDGVGERRKFLDKIVCSFDSLHARRIYSYEHHLRERIKLLQKDYNSKEWLLLVENKIAELSVAIAAARNEVVEIVQKTIYETESSFPKAVIEIVGEVENLLMGRKALEVEELIKERLVSNRNYDKLVSRTSFGVHRSDLNVFHQVKNMEASNCSTGEQKALLISIILAEARARRKWKGAAPILLFDEVIAHLDDIRREALFEECVALKTQCWFTGVDAADFTSLKPYSYNINMNDA